MSQTEPPAQTVQADPDTEPTDFGVYDRGERAEEMEAHIETVLADLSADIDMARQSEQFQEWLDAAAVFHDYSYKNQMLIRTQMPDATHVAGYNTWQNEFDRHVEKGETGIHIWRPQTVTAHKCPDCGNAPSYHTDNETLDCPRADSRPEEWAVNPEEEWDRGTILTGFTTTTVFDVSQTAGEPLPELDTAAEVGSHDDPDTLVDNLLDAADGFGLDAEVVAPENFELDGNGYCTDDGDTPRVVVKRRDTAAATAGTLIHEIAHGRLHAGVTDPSERSKREVEAEGVAYIVGRRLGLDMSNSGYYLASWTDDDTDVIRDRLKRITNTANDIVDALE
jgi:hypothetical protein